MKKSDLKLFCVLLLIILSLPWSGILFFLSDPLEKNPNLPMLIFAGLTANIIIFLVFTGLIGGV